MPSESANQAPEFEPAPLPPKPVLEGSLDKLIEWQAMAEGAYSPNTLWAQKADGAIFQAFCESQGQSYLPAEPKVIRAFIEHSVKAGKKPATIRRCAATIGRIHAWDLKNDAGDLRAAGPGVPLGVEGD
jgi:site-specific recombinase XerD